MAESESAQLDSFSEYDDNGSTRIPFFPTSEYECRNNVCVWWFEKDFSQTMFGKHASKGSNACTLITLLCASKLASRNVQMQARNDRLSHDVILAFAEAIVEGNTVYMRMMNEGRLAHFNLNIPEAMQAGGSKLTNIQEWKSSLYVVDFGENIYEVLQEGLRAWVNKNGPQKEFLFVVLIADNRSILLVFQYNPSTVTLFDSHQHSIRHGCVIAQAHGEHLHDLCVWIRRMYQEVYQSRPECFELSYIQIKSRNNSKTTNNNKR